MLNEILRRSEEQNYRANIKLQKASQNLTQGIIFNYKNQTELAPLHPSMHDQFPKYHSLTIKHNKIYVYKKKNKFINYTI